MIDYYKFDEKNWVAVLKDEKEPVNLTFELTRKKIDRLNMNIVFHEDPISTINGKPACFKISIMLDDELIQQDFATTGSRSCEFFHFYRIKAMDVSAKVKAEDLKKFTADNYRQVMFKTDAWQKG